MSCHLRDRFVAFAFVIVTSLAASPGVADDLPFATRAEIQPLLTQVGRLVEALDYLGTPLPKESRDLLDQAGKAKNDDDARQLVQKALDPLCLVGVHINPESRVKVTQGPTKPVLHEQGWSQFLVKVHNEAGVTAKLAASSPQAGRLFNAPPNQVRDRWLDMQMFEGRPMQPTLSGLELEYRIVQLYSRDAGKRSAVLAFNVGQGTQDIGFRNDATITFDATPSVPVTLRVLDEKGQPSTAGFVITDAAGRVYPSQAKRLAPDFAFHPQIYRHDGEKLSLPEGKYSVAVTRGPEYLPQRLPLEVKQTKGDALEFAVKLQRWVDPAKLKWWSGDHHIHAAGCAHYTNPTEGVHAPDMYRHILGEDLKVGCNLTWGPCFDYQKQFFTGAVDKVSNKPPYILRYDIEVSGFGSHQSGHICLLRLKDQIPPGGDSKNHWPTLGLNLYKWAKKQGAVCGPAHSGWGLQLIDPNTRQPVTELPTYVMSPFDGIGACEYIVDVTHKVEGPDGKLVPAVDFISTVDTPYVWELNIWYHTLNVGYRTRISGETDFPCIYGERVGLGRSYVKLDPPGGKDADKADGTVDYDAWCEGIRQGRTYVGDGASHLMDMKVAAAGPDTNGDTGKSVELGVNGSELKLAKPGTVIVTAQVAALLDEKANDAIRRSPYTVKPYWHIERARIEGTRKVPVELVVNGYPVARKEIDADGVTRDISFDVKLERSSWVAIRVLPSSHTNPVFVTIGDKPIRASKRSAEWCLKGVDQCWSQKQKFIAKGEMEDAKAAYEHARQEYGKLLAESEVE